MNRELLESICSEMIDLLERKNKDYGNAFLRCIKEFGLIVLPARLQEKVYRLKELSNNKEIEVKSETVEDTIKDIVGYGLLYLYDLRIEKNKN